MNDIAKLETGAEPLMQTTAAPALFVINLCASMTPMPAVPKNLKGFEKYKLYQVSRQEDGRRRFRLRLGFFTSETDAEWVLNSVRNLYPAAFTGCVTQEDLRYANDAPPPVRTVGSAPTPSAPITKPQAVAAATPVSKSEPVVKVSAKPTPAAAAVQITKQALTLVTSEPSQTSPAQDASPTAQPFHVARGVQVPETNLELTDEYKIPPARTAKPSAPAQKPTPQSAAPAARPVVPATPAPATAQAPAANRTAHSNPAPSINSPPKITAPRVVDDYVPILDTTLTIRTLTHAEAEDSNLPKWFAVQLALSEQPINLDTMPKLDIFAAYSLYSVAIMEGNGIKHALRLGFFRETVSADAVMGYLKAFFKTPAVTQISSAEYDRFAEPKRQPAPAAEPDAKLVKLNNKRPVTAAAPAVAAATSQRPPVNTAGKAAPTTSVRPDKFKDSKPRMPPPARPQSFLSRLIGRQLD